MKPHHSDDEQFPKILEIVQKGAVADTDPAFIKSARTAPLRDLQRRLTPVYNEHAAVMILPIDQLTESECEDLHMSNEDHWRAEPGKIAGRSLIDSSNAQPGVIPLNTETTNQLGIARYQTVVLPNLREVVMAWDEYRRINTASNGATCGCSKQTSPIAPINYTGIPTPQN